MKIGILTFHNAHNYGAVWQAYALKKVLKNLGHDVSILNYRNDCIEKNYQKKLIVKKEHKEKLGIWYRKWKESCFRQKSWGIQCDKFNEFIKEILLENRTDIVKKEDFSKLKMDAFICGSDQIWNSGLTGGIDPIYFLDFETNARKISYAPSKFYPHLKESEKLYFRNTLSKFHALSVREVEFAIELECETDCIVETVVDPVFLLDKEDFLELKIPIKENYKYILVYYLMEDSKLYDCSLKLAKQFQLPIIEIHYYRIHDKNRYQIADCGPQEFISYFDKAEYILTNSFHGVAFSIIFRKPFYAVYDKDTRKDNLLKQFGMTARHIYDKEQIIAEDVETLYKDVEKKINYEKEKSMKYLINSLA